MEEQIILTKKCNKCLLDKPLIDFRKQKSTKDGLTTYCIPCLKAAICSCNKKRYAIKREELIKQVIKWRKDNPQKIKSWRKKYNKKLKDNPIYRIKRKIYGKLKIIMSDIKKNKTTNKIRQTINTSSSHFKAHLEKLFKPGMSWENYGIIWCLDHVKPLSAFNLSDYREIDKINYYENIQPLFLEENVKKGSSYQNPNNLI